MHETGTMKSVMIWKSEDEVPSDFGWIWMVESDARTRGVI